MRGGELVTPAHPFYLFWVGWQMAQGKPAGRIYQPSYGHCLHWHAACILGGQLQDQTPEEMLMILHLAVA